MASEAPEYEARALFEAMGAREEYRNAAEEMIGGSGVIPEEPRRDMIEQVADRLYEEMVRAYAEEYTAEQLRELRAFFSSPIGRTYLEKRRVIADRHRDVLANILGNLDISSGSQDGFRIESSQ